MHGVSLRVDDGVIGGSDQPGGGIDRGKLFIRHHRTGRVEWRDDATDWHSRGEHVRVFDDHFQAHVTAVAATHHMDSVAVHVVSLAYLLITSRMRGAYAGPSASHIDGDCGATT